MIKLPDEIPFDLYGDSITEDTASVLGTVYDGEIDEIKDLIQDSSVNEVEKYPEIDPEKYFTISDMLEATNDKFIFIIDEWDYIFNNKMFKDNQNDFLEFLRNLLKDRTDVALAYMTGILPIKKHSSISALNMFDEYTMLNDMIYGRYFGFTEEEVKKLCEKQMYHLFLNLRKMKLWI